MSKNSYLYLADNDAFFKEVEKYAQNNEKDLEFKFLNLDLDNSEQLATILQTIIDQNFSAIFIQIKDLSEKLVLLLRIIKSHHSSKNTPLLAVVDSKNSIEDLERIYSFGFTYTFFKGFELKQFFVDMKYLTFIPSVTFPKYATTPNFSAKARLYALSRVNFINQTLIGLDTDLEFSPGDKVYCQFNFFDKFNFNEFEVFKSNKEDSRFHYLNTIELEIPYKSALSSEGALTESEFENWLIDKENEFFHMDMRVLIIDNNSKSFAEFINYVEVQKAYILLRSKIGEDPSLINGFKPHLVIYQMEELPEGISDQDEELKYNGTHSFGQMMNWLKSIPDYSPIVAVFNNDSNIKAFKKAHLYDKIIALKKSFDYKLLSTLIQQFIDSMKNPETLIRHYLPTFHEMAFIQMGLDIEITSINEHEITFTYDGELPYFTTYVLNLPNEIHITTVPPIKELEKIGSKNHYMGFITNADEKDKMEIRCLVNYLLSLEPEELQGFEIKSITELRSEDIRKKLETFRQEEKKKQQELKEKEVEKAKEEEVEVVEDVKKPDELDHKIKL